MTEQTKTEPTRRYNLRRPDGYKSTLSLTATAAATLRQAGWRVVAVRVVKP